MMGAITTQNIPRGADGSGLLSREEKRVGRQATGLTDGGGAARALLQSPLPAHRFSRLVTKSIDDQCVDRFMVAPPGQLLHGPKRRHVRWSKLPPTIRIRRDRQLLQQAGAKNHGPDGPMRLIRNREKPSPANPSRIESKGKGDRGNRAERLARAAPEAESRPAALFHVRGGNAKDPSEVGSLVVHWCARQRAGSVAGAPRCAGSSPSCRRPSAGGGRRATPRRRAPSGTEGS